MDTTQLKKMKRFRCMFRFIGVMFTLTGTMLLFSFGPLLLDPDATLLYNGVPTAEFGPKLSAVLFVSSFVLVGLLSLFSPARHLNKLFVWHLSIRSTVFRGDK